MKKLLLILALVIGAAVVGKSLLSDQPVLLLASGELKNPYAPGSALHAQQQEFVDQFNADPQLRDRFAGTFTSKGLYAEMDAALRRGARSLDGAQLISVTRAMAAVIPRLQQANCAKLMRPKDDFDRVLGADVQGALERLPPRHHLNFWRFYLAALKAEVNDLPERPIDLAARERALMELGRRFNQNDVARLQRVVQDPRSAPDADACWAINAFTHNATQLSPDHAEALARLIWGGQ
ncbi:hypothetical protein [Arenimonas metalli]|uniref:Uncharacterized protein n=1 Tax=Arenimonas metalli CF5-1 TaxID=1384056 RepID=A0A091BVU0_9GAMM|nr:hypothetical protein [Arenimonas metalli]KFN48425.1 hypothetical protein N787_00405 [Arenimonas metalli CF5-1]